MTEPLLCPACGGAIPAGSPAGLCPKCLMQAGLESQAPAATQDSPRSGSGFVPPTPEQLAARFPQLEILELLGRGGMGAVYTARQKSLDRLVAVKILPPDFGRDPAFAERFAREAKALARLNHPHIVSVHDFGESDGQFYLIMEFVDGVNLRQALRAGDIHPAEALAIVPQVCEALQFAHDEGIVHRDIKPENILLDRRGRVKIADFGLAKLRGGAEDHTLTGTHQVMGTLKYMAPEQMEGTHEVDHRADIYSLGVVFYELLTGEVPFGRFTPPSHKVQIDVRLDEVVLRALEQSPEQRWQQASQVKVEVEALSRGVGVPPARASEQGEKKRPSRDELERIVLELLPTDEIAAIRAYRDSTGCGLPEARDAVDVIGKLHGVRPPGYQLRDVGMKVLVVSGGLAFLAWAASERGWHETLPGQIGFFVAIGAALLYFVGLFISLQKSAPFAPPEAPAAPPPGSSSMILFCGMMMMASVAIILGGVACFVYGLTTQPPEGNDFWALSGAGLGTMLGGLGALAGTWNSYRQLEGAEDVMQSPRWTWFDTAIATLAMCGGAGLVVNAFLLPETTHPSFRFTLSIVGLLGSLFLILRSILRQIARERELGEAGEASGAGLAAAPLPTVAVFFGAAAAAVVLVALLILNGWNAPSGDAKFITGPAGPQLGPAAIRRTGVSPAQASAINEILAKYHREYLALQRRHTKVTTDEKKHLHVAIEPFSDECQALARQAVAELGGVVLQEILPKVAPGWLPPEIFGRGGECRVEAELWTEGDQYHFRQTLKDWVPAAGMTRGPSGFSYSARTPEAAFPPEFRVLWKEM